MTRKAAQRPIWRSLRSAIPEEVRREKSARLTRAALALPEIQAADTLLVYLSCGSEPDTRALTEALLRQGKRVAAPRCGPGGIMDAAEVSCLVGLRPGRWGILEPEPTAPVIPKREIALVLVPGLAFDRDGFRLGFGGGYYDRYLAGFHGTSLGLVFTECLTDRPLPREPFDLPVDLVLDDAGNLFSKKER